MKKVLAAVALVIAAPLTVYANEDRSNVRAVIKVAAADPQSMTTGVVKKLDLEQGKITINHGPIANLGMPAMTMVFRVADPALLATVKPDDKVNFVAGRVNGAFTVTSLVKVN